MILFVNVDIHFLFYYSVIFSKNVLNIVSYAMLLKTKLFDIVCVMILKRFVVVMKFKRRAGGIFIWCTYLLLLLSFHCWEYVTTHTKGFIFIMLHCSFKMYLLLLWGLHYPYSLIFNKFITVQNFISVKFMM